MNHPLNESLFKTPPFAHQRDEVAHHASDPARALFWEQGTGKTKGVLDTAAQLFDAREIDRLFITAPEGVHRAWVKDAVPQHLGVLHSAMSWKGASSQTIWQKQALENLLRSRAGLRVLSMTYDALMTRAGSDAAEAFLRGGRALFAADESTRIKNPKAVRTKQVQAFGSLAAYKRPLTGTPVDNGPFDLYSQIRFMQPKYWDRFGLASPAAFRTNFGVWEKDWNNTLKREFMRLTGYRNLDQLREFIAPISSRVLKSECLDLPPKLYRRIYVEPSAEQRRIYTQLKDEFFTEVGGGFVAAPLAITRLLRFQQVLSGYLPVEDEEGTTLVALPGPNPRLDALMEYVDDNQGAKGIIWARFTRDIDLIMERMRAAGEDAVRYDGPTRPEQREVAKERFSRGPAHWFVGNAACAGEGVDGLQVASVVAYYNNTFKLKDRLQSEDRAHRHGLLHSVTYTDFCAEGTVDEHIANSLVEKMDVAAEVTGDRLRSWL